MGPWQLALSWIADTVYDHGYVPVGMTLTLTHMLL